MNCYLLICICLKNREDLKKKKFPIENESEKQRVKWDLSEIKFTTKNMQRKTNISLQWCKISSKWWDSTFCSLECESHRDVHKDIECSNISMQWGQKSTAFLSHLFYRVFHGFGQDKFPDGGSVLGSSHFSILPQLPQKMMLGLKGVKINSKISNSHC